VLHAKGRAGARRASSWRSGSGQKKSQEEGRLKIDMTSRPVLSLLFVFFFSHEIKVQGSKQTEIDNFGVPILGIQNLRFDLAFRCKFKVCFGLFPINRADRQKIKTRVR
jgi:hypothetical protein